MERFSYVVFQKGTDKCILRNTSIKKLRIGCPGSFCMFMSLILLNICSPGPRDRFMTPDRAMSASFYDAPHLVSTFALGRHADMSEVIDPSRHVASPEALSKAVVQPTAVHSLLSHGGSKGHAADNADMDSKRDGDSQDKKGSTKHDSNKSDDKRSASGLRRSIQAQIASERARPPAPAPVFPIFSTNADEAVKPEHGAHHWPRLLMPILRAHRYCYTACTRDDF